MRARLAKFAKYCAVPGLALVVAGAATLSYASTSSSSGGVTENYVALGDSYAAGVGTLDYDSSSGACTRSPKGYPALWAAGYTASSFVSQACSGATTTDVSSKQLTALTASTDLITITVGGNDVGFTNTAASCILGDDTACTGAADTAVTAVNTTLAAQLDAVYNTIRTKAPNARVIVTGYPRLVDESATTCSLTPVKRQALNRGADALDAKIAERAAAAGFEFADPRPNFAGHGVCAATPWINAFSSDHVSETFHPTTDGYRLGYLPALKAATLAAYAPNDLPNGYTRCATEAGTCTVDGTRRIAYGAGAYRYRSASGTLSCTTSSFGTDPAAGKLKSCYTAPLGGPAGWSKCAAENATCAVGGPTMVAFGMNGFFTYRQVSATTSCTSTAFGADPIAGLAKACYLPPDGGPSASWTKCAAEGTTCGVTGTQEIVYGAAGSFVTARTSAATACTSTAFGLDPLANVAKACYVRTGGPVGYGIKCAVEGGTCTFTNSARTIAFGAAGRYTYAYGIGSTACNVYIFGYDPAPNTPKNCYLTQ